MDLEKIWAVIKKFNVALIWGAVVWVHTQIYLPYIENKIAFNIQRGVVLSLKDSLRENIINEMVAKSLGLELRLAEELNIPLYKVTSRLTNTIFLVDSASKNIDLVGFVKESKSTIDCGLKVKGGNLYYLTSTNIFIPCYRDKKGVYYTDKNGAKTYVEYGI
jgi:hypothetical protein